MWTIELSPNHIGSWKYVCCSPTFDEALARNTRGDTATSQAAHFAASSILPSPADRAPRGQSMCRGCPSLRQECDTEHDEDQQHRRRRVPAQGKSALGQRFVEEIAQHCPE